MNKNKILTETFTWMFIGLLICFLISYLTTTNSIVAYLVFGSLGGYGYYVFLILELILAIVFQLLIKKISPLVAKILYMLYTALTGLSLSGIFFAYTKSSICYIFLATAIIFLVFVIVGKKTKVDMTKWSVYLFFGLIAIIILEIINLFIANNSLNIILCIAGILIFCAYTAYDIKKVLDETYMIDTENKGIYCAFQLFLDFINIFIDLIRLFGESNN